jgi:ABC-type nitrate/sulfonate/bicarbonate transport system permease component
MPQINLRFAQPLISIFFVLAVWQTAHAFGFTNRNLFPGPFDVAQAAAKLYQDGVLVKDFKTSLSRAAVGFGIGASLGIIMGMLTARVSFIRLAVYPFFNILRPIPAIALVPIAIVWFGIGEHSKYFVIAYTVFLAVWLATHHGMEHIPETYIRASRSLGAPWYREFFEVVVPAAAPHILAGLRFGAALAFLSLVAAELTGASAGIGYRLDEARQYFMVDRMFVGLIELGLLGATLDAFFVYVGSKVVHWDSE